MPSKVVYLLFLSMLGVMTPAALGDVFQFKTIDFPGAKTTEIWGINNLGQLVGNYNNRTQG